MSGIVPPFRLIKLSQGGVEGQICLLHAEEEHYPPCRTERPALLRGHTHKVYHICLYRTGRGRFLLNKTLHACQRGTLVMTSPGDDHNFAPETDTGMATFEFTFSVVTESGSSPLTLPVHALVSDLAGVNLLPALGPSRLDNGQTRRLERICDCLLNRLLTRDAFWRFDVERLLLDMFGFLAREAHAVSDTAPTGYDSLARAREVIETRSHEPLRIADLARLAGLSSGHFSRVFKHRYGVTPIALQLALRVRAAKTLLRSGTMPVGEIAWRVGFADIYAFSRAFTRRIGVSPRAYRETAGPLADNRIRPPGGNLSRSESRVSR
jgi:AraC-like DNA-binding protein